MRRIRDHVRSNLVGYIALVLISGTAVALPGKNTVFSDDIVNGEVKKSDVDRNAITSGKILDGTVGNADLAPDAIDGTKTLDESLSGADVGDDTLTGTDVGSVGGADIDESTLGEVPEAFVAGRGRMNQGGTCDPESTGYVACVSVTFDLPVNGRVFVHGYGNGRTESDSDHAFGDCAIYTSATGGFPQTVRINADDNTGGEFGISLVTNAIGPGSVTFRVDCNQVAPGAIQYRNVGISAVQIGAS